MVRFIALVLFALLSVNTFAESKMDIIKKIYAPFLEIYRPDFEALMKNLAANMSAEEKVMYSRLPADVRPETIMNWNSMVPWVYEAADKAFSKSQLEEMQSVLGGHLGDLLFSSLREAKATGKDVRELLRARLAQEDPEELRKFFGSPEAFQAKVQMFQEMAAAGTQIMPILQKHLTDKILETYKHKKFSSQDSELCEFLYSRKSPEYGLPVCDAGAKAGDYRAGFIQAKSYWQGVGRQRDRDISKAKKLLKKLLKKDTDGEAHYYLAMLTKNMPEGREKPQDAYCLLQQASALGYSEAGSVLKEFSADQIPAKCR